MSGLAIGLIIGAIILVLGFGGCMALFVLGAVISAQEDDAPVGGGGEPTPAPIATSTGPITDVGGAIQKDLRAKGIPATSVKCPAGATGAYTCDLVIANGDHADVSVQSNSSGLKYEVNGFAFLDGSKLDGLFQKSAGKVDPNLKVPCFTGMLVKRVGTTFSCDVFRNGKDVGDVEVSVKTADGHVGMKYTVKK